MKKLIIALILVLNSTAAFAQLKVYKNGKTSIGLMTGAPKSQLSILNEGDSTYNFYLKGDKSGLFSQASGGSGTWLYGGNMSSLVSGGKQMYVGIKGEAVSVGNINRTNGRSFGVMGIAGNATSGWNYGVFGRIVGSNNGAAIYGTTVENENGRELKDRYAGYFNGKVSVKGDLTVRGYVDGIVLGPSLSEYYIYSIPQYPGDLEFHNMSSDTENTLSVSDNMSSMVTLVGTTSSNELVTVNKNDSTLYSNLTDNNDYTSMEQQYEAKNHYALSVDEVEAAYPDLVYTKDDGTKVINYIEMIPLLVESIKELKAQIATLQGGSSGNSRMMAAARGTAGGELNTAGIGNGAETVTPSLSQNDPNPFVDVTSIRMTIPETVANAMLCIYDMSGKQIRQITVNERGNVSASITSEGLSAGMYIYSLITDGKLVNTRKMILTK